MKRTSMICGGLVALALSNAGAAERMAEAIQDNSFFVEEAYNQEAGVVQHIMTLYGSFDRAGGGLNREWQLAFTQEWPIFSQDHQVSYTIPYLWTDSGGATENGFGDVHLDYRYQLMTETDGRPAIAPRLGVILPTGSETRGLGNNTLGWQFNLPVSKVISDRVTLHFNAGATLLPNGQNRDLVGYNLGASVIYALTPTFNLMLESVINWDEEADDDGVVRMTSALISPGFRYAVNLPKDAQLVLGIAAPIGVTSDSPEYGVFFYCSFEHSFPHQAESKAGSRAK